MDKIAIKEEVPLTDDKASQSEREFFHKVVSRKTNTDTILLDTDCDLTIKTEIKSETPFIKHLVKQIKNEPATSSNSWEINKENEVKQQILCSDVGSQNKGEFLVGDPVMMDKKYDNDQEIEIKVEPWWLEKDTLSVYEDIKDWDSAAVKSPRLCTEDISANTSEGSSLVCVALSWREARVSYERSGSDSEGSSLVYMASSGKDTGVSYERNGPQSENDEGNVIKILPVEKHVNSELSSQLSDGNDICNMGLLIQPDKIPHKSNICEKTLSNKGDLTMHSLMHRGKKIHKCEICEKKFTKLSHLKAHNLIHEGKKPYKCDICGKRFTQLGNLKNHNLIHEGNRVHKCKICEKRFTLLQHLKAHNFIHEGIKPHKCEICEKTFTQCGQLKRHNLKHEGNNAHKCKNL